MLGSTHKISVNIIVVSIFKDHILQNNNTDVNKSKTLPLFAITDYLNVNYSFTYIKL